MGIPKFFRWMSEKFPGLMVQAKDNQLPDIDNFYLDMNGIIHNCTHPCDGDVHFRISEEEMFEDIFNYVSTLFHIMKPKKYFFLAVDGVAPRAKMNQQRGRRFRSAKEAYDREEAALRRGDVLPTEQRFDSNCITPGTPFMVRLNDGLKDFIARKLATDPEWSQVNVILSGHETPGEGEHKVMDFIRYQRSQPDYDVNTRHCLYGLDTDLIMLGLSSHEPNFLLLREEQKLNNKKSDSTRAKSQRVDPTKIIFNVLYISLLRDYLEQEFLPLKPNMKFNFDLESIIDDWILICFLVGNDFIPHIPHFHIHKNALPKILEVYQSAILKMDGYINENGVLNLERFKVFAKMMAVIDFENYKMLVKQNGGECAKDDFSKLNEFVREKMRIHGFKRGDDSNGRPNEHGWRPGGRSGGERYNRSENPTHHSHFHPSGVWMNINRSNHAGNRNENYTGRHPNNGYIGGSGSNAAGNSTRQNGNVPTNTPRRNLHTTPRGKPVGYGSKSATTNGTPSTRTGVHSFTEEQLNNSITVCADGDIIDLSDEEYLSDEKFPANANRGLKNGSKGPINSRRSATKKDRKESVKVRSDDLDDFRAYKRTYYREKLKLDPDKNSILKVVQEYVRALQWNLHYYYHGCISWGWYYPYHYAPFISDIVNFKEVDTVFERGQPFKPYEQLLSVLPAASLSLLPKVYQSLVISKGSPLSEYFPTEVEYDLNGKQNDWEAVVLAPFIDEETLLKATVVCNLFLSPEERNTNVHGPHLLYRYVPAKAGLRGHRSSGSVKCHEIGLDGFFLPQDKIRYGLIGNDREAIRPTEDMRIYRIHQRR